MNEVESASKWLTDARISRGWTQFQLAKETGVGFSTISRIEQSQPPFPTRRILGKLTRVLGPYDGPVPTDRLPKNGTPDPFHELETIAELRGLTPEQVIAHFKKVAKRPKATPLRGGVATEFKKR